MSGRMLIFVNNRSFEACRNQLLVRKNWNPGLNISRAGSGVRPGVLMFQARVQHSEAGSRFGGRLRKFQPGGDYLEAGLDWKFGTGVWKFRTGPRTFCNRWHRIRPLSALQNESCKCDTVWPPFYWVFLLLESDNPLLEKCTISLRIVTSLLATCTVLRPLTMHVCCRVAVLPPCWLRVISARFW